MGGLTQEEFDSLTNPQPGQAPNMRRQPGETVEAYRARLTAAQGTVQPSQATQALDQATLDLLIRETAQPVPQQRQDEMTLAQQPIASRIAAFNRGLPLVGQWVDEGVGAVGRALGYPNAETNFEQAAGAMERQRPGQNAALQIGAGIVGSIPAVIAAGPYVAGAEGAGLLGQTIRGAWTGLTGGAAEGLINGAGDETGGGRFENSVTRGLIGGAMGGVLGAAVPNALALAGGLINRARQAAPNALASLNVSPTTSNILRQVIAADDPALAASNIAQAGRTGMLADSGPVAQGVLDAAMQAPGAGARLGRQRVEARASQVMGDMNQTLNDTLGKPQGLISVEEAIKTNAAPQIRQAYNAAYSTPIDYSSDAGRAVEDLLTRLPEGTTLNAIKKANDRMRFDGSPANQIMASIADDGSVTFQEMPNVMQLDYMKRAFDAIARDGTDPITGAMSSDAAFARKVAQSIRDTTRNAVPAYGQALELAADDLSQRAAVDFGRNILAGGERVTREMVAREVKDATKPELAAMRLALRSQIDETLANVRRFASNPGADPDGAQLSKAFGMLNSEAAQTKIRALLGPDADFVISSIDQAQRALGVKSAVARNSATAGRQLFTQFLNEATAPGVIGKAAQGEPLQATQRVIQELTNMTPENITAAQQKIVNELTDVLTRSGNLEAMQALHSLERVSAGKPITELQAYQITRAATVALATAGHQRGTQSLQRLARERLAQLR